MMIRTTSSIIAALDVILINVTRCRNDITTTTTTTTTATTTTTTTITSAIGLINIVRRDEREDVAERTVAACAVVVVDDDRAVVALVIRWVDKIREVSTDGSELGQGVSLDESFGAVLPR